MAFFTLVFFFFFQFLWAYLYRCLVCLFCPFLVISCWRIPEGGQNEEILSETAFGIAILKALKKFRGRQNLSSR